MRIGDAWLSETLDRSVQVRYDDPDGGTRHCVNSEIADLAIEVYERRDWGWERTGVLRSAGGAHFELGRPVAHAGLDVAF